MDRHSSGVLEQLKERHIVRWGIAYIAGAWVALQAAELLAGIFDWSTAWLRVLTILLVFGFFAAVTLAWFHGEKGQQRFNRVEVAILVLIAIVAGITTYSPLRHWQVGPGKKVGIVGLGGLGHMGVKFARADRGSHDALAFMNDFEYRSWYGR